jgi:signal-transduction protein with cAMP-binding, CBS, and nucleotidyltransferase domain
MTKPAAGVAGAGMSEQGPERERALFKMFGRYCPRGTILFNEHDPGEEMYVVQSGSLRVSSGSGEDAVLSAGDILGEESLMERAPRRVRAEAVEDSRLLVVDSRNIESVVRNGPLLTAAVMERLMGQIDDSWRKMHSWKSGYILGKIEALFRDAEGGRDLSATEVSDRTHIDDADVSRTLAWLAEKGALAKEGDCYRLLDVNLLGKLAGDCEGLCQS